MQDVCAGPRLGDQETVVHDSTPPTKVPHCHRLMSIQIALGMAKRGSQPAQCLERAGAAATTPSAEKNLESTCRTKLAHDADRGLAMVLACHHDTINEPMQHARRSEKAKQSWRRTRT